MDSLIPGLACTVLFFVAIIVFGYLYARGPSFKFGGRFRDEVKRQRRFREEHEKTERQDEGK